MSFVSQIKFLPKEIKSFAATEALLGIGMGIFGLVLNLHLLALGISPEVIGAISSVGVLVMGGSAVLAGILANYIGRKPVFIIGILFTGIGYGIFGISTSLSLFYFAQIINSIGISFLITTEIQLLFYYSKTKDLETFSYSLLFASFTLFSGLGTLLGGFIPNWLPFGTTKYQYAIYISSGAILLAAFLRSILLPNVNLIKNQNGSSKKSRLYNKFDGKIFLLSFFILLSGMAFSMIIPFQNVIVKYRFNWSDEYVSYLLTISGIFLFIGSIIMPYIINKFGRIKAFYYIYILNLIFTIILVFNVPLSVFSIVFLFRSGSFTLLNNMIESQTMSVVSEEKRDLFAGTKSFIRSIGSAIASYLAGYILEGKNYNLPFLITFFLIGLSFIYFVFLIKPIFDKEYNSSDLIFEPDLENI